MPVKLRVAFLLSAIVAATAADWLTSLPEQDDWAPLSAEEIADAHTCSMGTMIAICAGKKRIATGIIVADQMVGKSLSETADDVHDSRLPDGTTFASTAEVSLMQPGLQPGHPEWRKTFYILDDEQLALAIKRAREDPNWKPPGSMP